MLCKNVGELNFFLDNCSNFSGLANVERAALELIRWVPDNWKAYTVLLHQFLDHVLPGLIKGPDNGVYPVKCPNCGREGESTKQSGLVLCIECQAIMERGD